MIIEIILGIFLGILLIYLYFLYVKWASSYYPRIYKPKKNKKGIIIKDEYGNVVKDDDYAFLLPSKSMVDTYKPINFWITYTLLKFTL